jgi:hypothetical protein
MKMPKKKVEPQVDTPVEEIVVEPSVEELVEEAKEEALDPNAPTISMKQMSLMLSNQTFTIVGSLGQGLKTRYDQVVAMEFENLPPKARKEKKVWQKGYISALNDIAEGLLIYQNDMTERAIADGLLTREDVPDLPEQPAPESDEAVE